MKVIVYEGIRNVKVKDVHNLKKRDRVIVSFPIACGHCWYCEHGENGAIFGYSDTFGGYDGGQAEYLRVPY